MPHRKHISIAACFLALVAAITSAEPTGNGAPENIRNVSLIQLIATPERYEGQRVSVTGFVHIEFEGDAIWLHRDDFLNGIHANSVWLQVDTCTDWDGKPMSGYGSVAGRFTGKHHGHMGLWQSAIEQVTGCGPAPMR